MFNGCVHFEGTFSDNGLSFPRGIFRPAEPSVDYIELESDGKTYRSTVRLKCVPTENDGKLLAEEANTKILDRLAFRYPENLIDDARITASNFERVDPAPGVMEASVASISFTGHAATFIKGLVLGSVEHDLETKDRRGERYYGTFRTALQCGTATERFMHLYHLLMMFNGDDQKTVEAFIVGQDPTVLRTPDPRDVAKGKANPRMETIYTRLRNEFAHADRKVDLARTKAEMAENVSSLARFVKRAIEQQP
jgi:hypothetical protein